jgi:GH24 family phage-related lysozyme (muramidase)
MAKSDYSFPAGIDEITSKSILFTLGNEGRGEEGRSGKLYYDTSKPPIPTIGIGFNLNRDGARATIEAAGLNYDDILAGKVTLTNEQMDKLFLADIRDAQKSAKRIFSDWDKFSDDRQVALTDMILNLGVGKFTGFDKMVRAIKSGNWKAAANEAVKSNWFTQVKDRGPRVVALLRGGDETPSAISRPKSKPSTPAELDLAKLVSAGVIPDPAPEWLRRAMDPSTPTTGQNETVQTASFYSEKHGGTLLVPTIRMGANGLFKPEDPVAEAIRRDDFILVPGPPGDATEARATALSRFISDMLIAKARAK